MNCKPGDLAIVVSAYLCIENIGRIVEVVRAAVPGIDYTPTNDGFVWIVRSTRPMARAHFLGGRMKPGLEAACSDCNLRPITGLPVDEKQRDEVTA